MGTAMIVPELHTDQTTGSLPKGILVTEFIANIYDRWSKNKPPSTDRPVDSLSVWESALAPEAFPYARGSPPRLPTSMIMSALLTTSWI